MPVTTELLTIVPQVAMTVDILDSAGNSTACYTTNGGSSTHTLPLAISASTDFFIPNKGTYTISAKVAGVEVANGSGGTQQVQLSGAPVTVPVTLQSVELASAKVPIPASPVAFTQTYSTASATVATATVGAVATTAATNSSPYGFGSAAQADAIPVAINALTADVLVLRQVTNKIIDILQAAGMAT